MTGAIYVDSIAASAIPTEEDDNMPWTFVPDREAGELGTNDRCEDYPCCGHTPLDPCGPQYYDAPGFYDITIAGNEHNLCNHEEGECRYDGFEDEFDEDCIHEGLFAGPDDNPEDTLECQHCLQQVKVRDL